MIDEDKKYKYIIDSLKNLSRKEAPVNFEDKLWKRIHSSHAEKENKSFSRFFPRLVPAAALVATAVFLVFVMSNNAVEFEDPLMAEPILREDVIELDSKDKIFEDLNEAPLKKEKLNETRERSKLSDELQVGRRDISAKAEAKFFDEDDSLAPQEMNAEPSVSSVDVVGMSSGVFQTEGESKQSLNFRQVKLSEEEKKDVISLKSRILVPDSTKKQ